MTTRVVLTTAPGSFAGIESLLADLPIVFRRHPLQVYQTLPTAALEAALDAPGRWQGLVLTSPRAASILAACIARRGTAPTLPCYVTGEATARALDGLGLQVRIGEGGDATQGAAEMLASRIIGDAVRGPLLHLAGDPHRDDLTARLQDAGISVETLVVYRSSVVGDVEVMALLNRADLVILGAPMTARAMAAQGEDALAAGYVAIGATTAEACRERGLPLLSVADHPTAAGLAAAIRQALQRL